MKHVNAFYVSHTHVQGNWARTGFGKSKLTVRPQGTPSPKGALNNRLPQFRNSALGSGRSEMKTSGKGYITLEVRTNGRLMEVGDSEMGRSARAIWF